MSDLRDAVIKLAQAGLLLAAHAPGIPNATAQQAGQLADEARHIANTASEIS